MHFVRVPEWCKLSYFGTVLVRVKIVGWIFLVCRTADRGDALNAADWENVGMIAHGMRGVASQLGASELGGYAEQLEALAKTHTGDRAVVASAVLTRLAPRLGTLIEAIRTRFPREEAQEVVPDMSPGDSADLSEVRATLRHQLENADPMSHETLRRHATLLRSAWGDAYEQLASKADDFDFDGALELEKRL